MSVSNSSSAWQIDGTSLDRKILELTLSVYNNPYLSRKAVDFVIESFDSFISDSMIPFMQNQLVKEMKLMPNEKSYYKAKFILEKNKNPFKIYSSEHLRFKIYEQESLYVPPQLIEIGKIPHFVHDGQEVHVEMKTIYQAHISPGRKFTRIWPDLVNITLKDDSFWPDSGLFSTRVSS